MDDLLREFLTETGEHLDTVDRELVRFEQCAGDPAILRNIFRLVHTIKGTCGFLGLPRLEALAHAAETLMGRLRDGMPPTTDAVTAILAAIDRIKEIMAALERSEGEPAGSDQELIAVLEKAGTGLDSIAAAKQVAPAAPLATVLPPDREPPRARSDDLRSAPSDPHAVQPGPAAAGANTIRVAVDTIENLMTVVSELVLTRNQLLDIARRSGTPDGYKAPLQRLSQVTAELQESVMKARMQPIGSAWAKLPRVVRDLAPELGKKLELVMSGTDTELDRQLLELIRDPLTHMVRNAADHGLESPAERIAAGKRETGTIRLAASNEGGTITITVSDDGRGLDLAAIGRRALSVGLVSEPDLARLSDERVAAFIFHPGFSTNAVVTAVSGRGVGMDVVKTNIDAIGGLVTIATELGRGTTFTVEIPLTLAIMAALIVGIDGHRFAVPQNAVVEVIRLSDGSDHRLEFIGGAPLLRVRDELLPVVSPGTLLKLADQGRQPGQFVAVMQVASRRFGLLLDAVFETEEIVVKPLGAPLRHIPVFSGHTILGDGAVVLILDPSGVARQIGHDMQAAAVAASQPVSQSSRRNETMSLLVFRGGAGFKAVPLPLVTRLEEAEADAIERAGDQACLQYRGRLMPVVTLGWPLKTAGKQPMIVFHEGERSLALAIDEIVDIVEEAIDIQPVGGRDDLVGTAIVRGRATEILDVAGLAPWLGAQPAGPSNGRLVLLVDDDEFFRELLSPVLRAAGYSVRTAASAADAMRALARGDVETLVTDLDLAGRDGLDLVAELRRDAGLATLPVVVLASAATSETLERAHGLGVSDLVGKFDRPGLLAALAEAVPGWRLAA